MHEALRLRRGPVPGDKLVSTPAGCQLPASRQANMQPQVDALKRCCEACGGDSVHCAFQAGQNKQQQQA